MKLIYLHTNILSDKDVAEALEEMCELTELMIPFWDKEKERECVDLLAASIREQGAEAVMALRYFPAVSLVCSVMKVKYIAWICAEYDPGIYSGTMLQDCNYIFLADYALYREFETGQFRHMAYLPLAVAGDRVEKVLEAKGIPEEFPDVVMTQDIFTRESLTDHPLAVDSPLKDAVKGYLEGCLACQRQISGLPAMAGNLPPYVLEELYEHFPPRKEGDSVETASHYYDCRYFNPMITWDDRDVHLNMLAEKQEIKTVWLYNGCRAYKSFLAACYDRVDYRTQLPFEIRRGKINYVVTSRNIKSGIPQIAWDIMAAGGFLLTNFQEDYLRLFPDCPPAMYTEPKELVNRAVYYLQHKEERRGLAEELAQIVRRDHTYRHRLARIFESL